MVALWLWEESLRCGQPSVFEFVQLPNGQSNLCNSFANFQAFCERMAVLCNMQEAEE